MERHRQTRKVGASVHRGRSGHLGFRAACDEIILSMMKHLEPLGTIGRIFDWAARVILIMAGTLILVQAADRHPPFEILEYSVPTGRPGDKVTFRAKVRRDIERNCSATMSRSFFDASRARHDIDYIQFSPELIAGMERATPGEMAPTMVIPQAAEPGLGELVSSLSYVCNRVHSWGWPIHVTTRMQVYVLEP